MLSRSTTRHQSHNNKNRHTNNNEGRYDEAAEIYKKVIQAEPNDARNYYKLFRVHLRQQK